jgi:hypothetical protein
MLRRYLLAGWLVDPPLRLGIIGTGNRGASLGAVAAQLPGVDVTALCDIQLSQTARLAGRLPRPPKTYAEPQRLLDEAVRMKQPFPIDVYDSVEWSSLIPLTTASVRARGVRQDFPHFRRAAK